MRTNLLYILILPFVTGFTIDVALSNPSKEEELLYLRNCNSTTMNLIQQKIDSKNDSIHNKSTQLSAQ